MVVSQLKQMNEDNHLLHWYKNIAANKKRFSKAVEASFGAMDKKLH